MNKVKLLEKMREHKSNMYGLELSLAEIEICKKALDKQEAIKPIEKQSYILTLWYCPICNSGLYSNQKYCDECGKKIDWEEGGIK